MILVLSKKDVVRYRGRFTTVLGKTHTVRIDSAARQDLAQEHGPGDSSLEYMNKPQQNE